MNYGLCLRVIRGDGCRGTYTFCYLSEEGKIFLTRQGRGGGRKNLVS